MRAAVLHELHKPPSVENVQVEAPRNDEALVRIAASGVCRSDLHVIEGTSVIGGPPLVLGHEGAGVVEAVGPDVRGLAPGDHVVIGLYGPCGSCHACRAGSVKDCWSDVRLHNMEGLMPDGSTRLSLDDEPVRPMVGVGSLAEQAVVREAQLVKVDRDLPLDLLCLAGCGVTTGLGAVFNTAAVTPGASVAVIGCGGVGLNVVQGARIAGAARIVACDVRRSKLDLAARLGATDVVQVRDDADLSDAIRERVPGGVDFAFEVIGLPEVVARALACTRSGGTAVQVGAPPPGSTIPVDARLLFSDRRLLGCLGGGNVPERDIPRIVALYRSGVLQLEELVSQRLPLERVNEAFDALLHGELARTVVQP